MPVNSIAAFMIRNHSQEGADPLSPELLRVQGFGAVRKSATP
jgi:hypothetical protein